MNLPTVIQRLLFGFVAVICALCLLGSTQAPEPAEIDEPQVVLLSEMDGLAVEAYSEPVPVEPVAEVESVEMRYAHLNLTLTQEEKGLMALVVYHESRGEPHDGQRAVAEIILNRVLSDQFPGTVKEVIYQDGQFSCAGALTSVAIREPGALANCFDVVDEVLSETEYVIPEYYLFFSTGSPAVADHIKIGNHTFR